jgi:hypothetical protein
LTWEAQLERALHELEELLVAAADARSEAESLDEKRKQVRATMFVHFRSNGAAVGEAEFSAVASPAYKAAADEWDAANRAWRKADAKAEVRRLRFEAWRTSQATERAKIGLR